MADLRGDLLTEEMLKTKDESFPLKTQYNIHLPCNNFTTILHQQFCNGQWSIYRQFL